MRVLHVGKYYHPYRGGMETALKTLCDGDIDSAITDVLVANVTRRTVVERVGPVQVIRAGTLCRISSIPFCPSFPYWLRKCPADIVCLHEPNPLALLSYLLVRPRGRLVIWFHSKIVRRPLFSAFYAPLLKTALGMAERIVVASPDIRDHTPALSAFRSKCVVIPYGIDLSRFELTPAVRERVARIRTGTQSRLVLFVGRLTYYKGVEYLISAMTMVKATLVIAGHGPGLTALEQQVRTLGLQDRVQFVGELPDEDVCAFYHACDVFVLPSVELSEAFGIVQIEAMACAKPVISTNLPTGVPWVNQHGVTGLVVEPREPEALAAAINELLRDEPLRMRLGRQARLRAEAEFTEETVRDRTAAVYREVMVESGR